VSVFLFIAWCLGVGLIVFRFVNRRKRLGTLNLHIPGVMVAIDKVPMPRHKIALDQLQPIVQKMLDGARFDCLLVLPAEGDNVGFALSLEEDHVELSVSLALPDDLRTYKKFKEVAESFATFQDENTQITGQKDLAYTLPRQAQPIAVAACTLLTEVYGLTEDSAFHVSALNLAQAPRKDFGLTLQPSEDLLADVI